MAGTKTVDFDIVNLAELTEKEINTPEGMKKISDNIIYNIEGALTKAAGNTSFLNFSLDKSKIFDNTYIGNHTVNEYLNIAEKPRKIKFDAAQRNEFGAYIVAKALLDETPVRYSEDKNDIKNGVNINKTLEKLQPSLSLWEKFLALFNITFVKRKERNIEEVKTHIEKLKTGEARDISAEQAEHERIVESNFKLANERLPKYQEFYRTCDLQKEKVINSFLHYMPDEAFGGKEKSLENLPTHDIFNKNNFDTLAMCAMLKNRCDLEEAFNPNNVFGREEVGQELGEIAMLISSDDPNKKNEGIRKTEEILYAGAKVFIERSVPSELKTQDVLETDKPYYLSFVAKFGTSLPFMLRQTDTYQNNPNEKLMTTLNNLSMAGDLYTLNRIRSAENSIKPKINGLSPTSQEYIRKMEKAQKNVMELELINNFCSSVKIRKGFSMEEFSNANIESIPKIHAFSNIVERFRDDSLAGVQESTKLSDIIDKKVDVSKRVEHLAFYRESLKDFSENTLFSGTPEQAQARSELAKSVAAKMSQINKKNLTQKQLHTVENNLLTDKTFLKNTSMEPEDIRKLIDKPSFLKKLATEIIQKENEANSFRQSGPDKSNPEKSEKTKNNDGKNLQK